MSKNSELEDPKLLFRTWVVPLSKFTSKRHASQNAEYEVKYQTKAPKHKDSKEQRKSCFLRTYSLTTTDFGAVKYLVQTQTRNPYSTQICFNSNVHHPNLLHRYKTSSPKSRHKDTIHGSRFLHSRIKAFL